MFDKKLYRYVAYGIYLAPPRDQDTPFVWRGIDLNQSFVIVTSQFF